MKFDSIIDMQRQFKYSITSLIFAFTCVSSSGPASNSMIDGDADVLLTASHLREVLRHTLFIKTTPVCLSVCGIFKCLV